MSDVNIPNSLWPLSLNRFDITLPAATENLALDEVLLNAVETDPTAACLRFWSPSEYFVVLGRSNRVETEVDLARCQVEGVPVYRRSSGGGTVVVGPGCLCYSLALPLTADLRHLGISHVTARLMNKTAEGLRVIQPEIEVCGTSDLVCAGKKFSGNAQRWLRNSFVHHGTLLFDFDLTRIERYLRHPSREPNYRESRRHSEFVGNLAMTSDELKRAITDVWNGAITGCPQSMIDSARALAESRYKSGEWRIDESVRN